MPRKAAKPSQNNLRAWRNFRNLTQNELAEEVGTAGNVIGLLESGERKLSEEWLRKLAAALDTTPGFLLDHDPNDLDAIYLRSALEVAPENREHILEIMRTFRRR